MSIERIAYPGGGITELLAKPYGPILGNYLAVLSAADAALARDGRQLKVPFATLVPAGCVVMLECAARSAEMMTAGGRYAFDPMIFREVAFAAASRVVKERSGLIVTAGEIPAGRQ